VDNPSDRVKVLVADQELYPQASLASAILYSPTVLKSIRAYLRGRPAYIVPGRMSAEDLRLAIELNLPLMAPEPEVASVFGSKSGGRRVFAAADVAIPVYNPNNPI